MVSHDIGIMVAYAYAARYPDKVERLVVMDAPIPGIAPWDDIVKNPALWHFSFNGPDAERLVAGRERIYLDRIWNAFSGDPKKPDEATRAFYAAQYAQPGAMKAGMEVFRNFDQDAKDNAVFVTTKLTMPVLVLGGEKSGGDFLISQGKLVATNVEGVLVLGSGHWLVDEAPGQVIPKLVEFLMGDRHATCLKIPPGVAHGCRALELSHLLYITSSVYDRDDEGRIAHDDPSIGYDWTAGPAIK